MPHSLLPKVRLVGLVLENEIGPKFEPLGKPAKIPSCDAVVIASPNLKPVALLTFPVLTVVLPRSTKPEVPVGIVVAHASVERQIRAASPKSVTGRNRDLRK